jgi:methyl-accepting chemotaxis protein
MDIKLIIALVVGANIIPFVFFVTRKVFKKSIMTYLCILLLILTALVFNLGFITSRVDPIHFVWMGPVTSLAFIGFLYLVYRKIVSPIKGIKENLDAAANYDLTLTMNGNFRNEFRSISDSYNNFVSQVGEILNDIKEENRASVSMNSELTLAFDSTAVSIEQTEKNVAGITELVNTLNDEIGTCRSLSTGIQDSTRKSLESIGTQNAEIVESSSAIEEMGSSIRSVEESISSRLDVIEQLVSIAVEGENKMNENNERIQRVVDSTNNIGAFIEVINDVAAQTNLVAINAAIEAAHAGESGKGFAVVADEIRKLAEDASANAQQIGDSLGTVVTNIEKSAVSSGSINQSFREIFKGVKEVSESIAEIKNAMTELSASSGQIVQSLTNLKESANSLQDSGIEIDTKAREIADSMIHINDISERSKKGIGVIDSGIAAIVESAQVVKDSGHKRDEHVRLLNGLINKFSTKEQTAVGA